MKMKSPVPEDSHRLLLQMSATAVKAINTLPDCDACCSLNFLNSFILTESTSCHIDFSLSIQDAEHKTKARSEQLAFIYPRSVNAKPSCTSLVLSLALQ
jgi:hypothetical protein